MPSIPLATRFNDWVISQLVASGCFGPCSKIVKHGIDPDRKGEDQFMSTVQFFELQISNENILRTVNLVVKFQPENEEMRELVCAKDHFRNEVLMYSEILPLINKDGIVDDLFCKYYHGISDINMSDDSDFVALEDLSKKGYRLTDEKVFLDYDHCILVLKGIGRFHALSYIAKKNNYSEFKALTDKIREKWSDKRLTRWKYLLKLTGQRGIQPLIDKHEDEHLLKEYLENYEDPVAFYKSLVEPHEPEAVLCHGDFCRNNMLFSYDEQGKPKSVKFFDLQTPRYSSPVIDLSFFLLMNTSQETKEKYWDEFIRVYKESVKSVARDIDVPEFDISRRVIYGYLHCSFFLPMMFVDSSSFVSNESILHLPPYEIGLAFTRIGGEKETELLTEIVRFLLKKGYIREKYY